MMREDTHIFSGMKRDVHPSKQDSQMLWDCLNMRLTSRNETESNGLKSNTMLSLTNESSTRKLFGLKEFILSKTDIKGAISAGYIGHTNLGNYIILFVSIYLCEEKRYEDVILRVDTSLITEGNSLDSYVCILYKGSDLEFDIEYPIQAVGVYETEFIQKVYWVDGKHQPRVINISLPEYKGEKKKNNYTDLYKNYSFDFVPELQLEESINIDRRFDAVGSFHSGVIQYAFTYYYKYGQESNIFYTSPLMYISYSDRGAKEDDIINCAFGITIKGFEKKFDYIRVYSILRTTKDAVPLVRRVADLEIPKGVNEEPESVSPINLTSTIESKGIGGLEGPEDPDEEHPDRPIDSFISNPKLDSNTIYLIDTGTIGDTVDPQSLLFLGGKSIKAGCISIVENTLFLGDLTYDSSFIKKDEKETIEFGEITSGEKENKLKAQKKGSYNNAIQLDKNYAAFKYAETYRLGVQFQYKDGSWSQPIPWIVEGSCDYEMDKMARLNENTLYSTKFIGSLKAELADYKRVRPVIAIPQFKDRTVLAQGFLCPTVFQLNNRLTNSPFAQSSWFLRPFVLDPINRNESYAGFQHLATLDTRGSYATEIQNMCYEVPYSLGNDPEEEEGVKYKDCFNKNDAIVEAKKVEYIDKIKGNYIVDQSILTFHSPDIEFNEDVQNIINDNSSIGLKLIGTTNFSLNISKADISLSSVTAGDGGSLQPSLVTEGFRTLIAGGYFEDSAIDDYGDANTKKLTSLKVSRKFNWLIYPWHRSGSLNNDIARPSGMGQRTSILKKKVISNFKYAESNKYFKDPWEEVIKVKDKETGEETTTTISVESQEEPIAEGASFQIFNSNEVSLIKFNSDAARVGSMTYYGNVDTVVPTYEEYDFYVTGNNGDAVESGDDVYDESGNSLSTIYAKDTFTIDSLKTNGGRKWFGDYKPELRKAKEPIRMRYKSTPHVVVKLKDYQVLGQVSSSYYFGKGVDATRLWMKKCTKDPGFVFKPKSGIPQPTKDSYLFIAELRQKTENPYGGNTEEAYKNNIWIPAGESVRIKDNQATVEWTTGDTWYQRYDCLKTYPFSQDDENQIVEIGSVILETRFNLEGRYDRNKGLTDNTKVSPLNFNLMNPVYSQLDNFFNYRIMDEDYYLTSHYPNQIAWSLPKASGAIKDEWTSINLTNTLDLDGSQGKVINIASYNDTLLAFQESAIQHLIFNPRVQVQASDGVPIEIANSQKMQGTRIISDTIGCQDKFSMTSSPYGIYFVDNNNGTAFLFNGKINDIGANLGQMYWFRENYSTTTWKWIMTEDGNNSIRLAYDPKYKDVYFTPGMNIGNKNPRNTLCYSELLGKFSGFFTYDGAVLIPTDNKLFSIHKEDENLCLYEHIWSKGNTKIFGKKRSYSFSFISNQNGAMNKTFDTIELRASLYDIKNNSADIQGTDITHNKQSGQPFNYIRVETETQDTGKQYFNDNSLRKKFNIWRGIVPRDIKSNSGRARIKNTWAKIELGNDRTDKGKDYVGESSDNSYTILHDITVKYSI